MNFIGPVIEAMDSEYVNNILINSKWMDSDVILVNCGPQYSSRLTQLINHKTSFLNKNNLYEQISLELPLEGETQVWDYDTKEYLMFDKYLHNWMQKHLIFKENKFLFITNTIDTGKLHKKVRALINGKAEYRFLSLYVNKDSDFTPDYYLKQYEKDNAPVFFWENKNKG